MTTTDDSSSRSRREREETKQLVLEAAAEILRSGSADWERVLTFDRLEQGSGVDRSDINKLFGKKAGLVKALVDHLLKPSGDDEWSEEMTEQSVQSFAASSDFAAVTGDMADYNYDSAVGDDRIFSQMMLWSMASTDPTVRQNLRELYAWYDEQFLSIWSVATASASERGVQMRQGIGGQDFITIMTALLEGLLIRQAVDPDAIPGDLYKRAMLALYEAVFLQPGESQASRVGDRIGLSGL